MDIKKHLSRGVLLLAAFALIYAASDRLLFANADGGIRAYRTDPEPYTIYTNATPTSTGRVLSASVYQSATPTSAIYTVEEDTPAVSVVTAYSDRFAPLSDGGTVIVAPATPTTSQVLSASVVEEQPAPEPQYISYLPVYISVSTAVENAPSVDGFIYNMEYMGCAGTSSVTPDLPSDMTAALAGNDSTVFSAIYFTEPGQYYFKVCQDHVNGALNMDKGYRWNDTWYFVGVCVEEGRYGLESTVSYYEVGGNGVCIPRGDSAVFTQSYA